MLCTNCGARLMESDQFCPKCGAKAIKDSRCPDCGAVLRDGAKFCPKCGRSVGGKGRVGGVSDDTLDIPIDAIERNILSETAAEIKADRRTSATPRKSAQRSASTRSASSQGSSERGGSPRNSSSHSSSERSAPQRSAPAKRREPAPEPPRKKRVVYREEDWEDEDWEDDDWDDDDWDDDEEDEGVDVITVMTAIIGCVLLVVVAVLGFNLFRQYVPKDYDKAAEEEQEQEEEQEEQGQEQTSQDGENLTAGDERETYTLTITHNVNVRDNPGTHGTNVLRVAKEGETYTSYGALDGGEWYEILLEDGTTGYVFYEYISIE